MRAINDLRRRSLYGLDIEDLNQKLQKFLPDGGRDTTDFGVLVYFGETSSESLEDIARQVFETFPCPILRIEFERERVWQISAIKPTGLHTLSDPQEDAFAQALDKFSKKLWRKPRARRKFRFDLAMLADGNEPMPPSNKRALKRFVDAGEELGIEVDTISKNDYTKLAEYDGLFIRETTALDNHTYRFANKAEKEDMVVIDDPSSILKCTNKIYLHDLLTARKLPTPKTEILYRDEPKKLAELPDLLGFPIVLKIPDGSFSRGIVKVENVERLKAAADDLFQHTALVLAQEFMFTEFDWRIGVLESRAAVRVQVLHVARALADLQPRRERHREIRRLRDAAGARGAGRSGQARAPSDRADRRRSLRRRPEAVERATCGDRSQRQPVDRRRHRGRLSRRGSVPPHHGRVPAAHGAQAAWLAQLTKRRCRH